MSEVIINKGRRNGWKTLSDLMQNAELRLQLDNALMAELRLEMKRLQAQQLRHAQHINARCTLNEVVSIPQDNSPSLSKDHEFTGKEPGRITVIQKGK